MTSGSDKRDVIDAALGAHLRQLDGNRGEGREPVLDRLGLNGEISVAGRTCSTTLCRTPSGLWLVGLPREAEPVVVDLLAPERTFRYHEGVLGDRLEVDAWRLGIPRGRSERTRELIAFARITRHFGTGALVVREPRPDAALAWSGPLVESLDPHDRSYAERLARRATHEGSVSDVSRRGLLDAYRAFRKAGLAALPVAQILDEVLFEVPTDELPEAARIGAEAMRNAFLLDAPLRVGLEAGPNWADLEPYPI